MRPFDATLATLLAPLITAPREGMTHKSHRQQAAENLARAMRDNPALRAQVEAAVAKRQADEIAALAKSEEIARTMRAERAERKAAAWAKRQPVVK